MFNEYGTPMEVQALRIEGEGVRFEQLGQELTVRFPTSLPCDEPCSQPGCRGPAHSRCGGDGWDHQGGCGHHFCHMHMQQSLSSAGLWLDLCGGCQIEGRRSRGEIV